MKTTNCFLGLVFCLLVGCGGKSGGGSDSGSTTNPVGQNSSTPNSENTPTPRESNEEQTLSVQVKRMVEFSEDFTNYESFIQNINSYIVTFTATSGHFYGSEVRCSRFDFDPNQTKIVRSFDTSGLKAVVPLSLDENDLQNVTFRCLISDGIHEIKTKPIDLKKSIVVKGTQNIVSIGVAGITKLETLVLDTDSVLTTDGKNFNLKVKQMISRKGKIVTFPADKKYIFPADQKGTSAGYINLDIESLKGVLSFELRGLEGGTPSTVPNKQPQRPADRALDGDGSYCNGRDGYTGYQGLQGLPGFNGGDSGFLRLTILEETSASLNVAYFPGIGGKGGNGGEGGEGSPGGHGVELRIGGPSIMGSNGRPGHKGSVGNDGARGLSGNNLESSITIGNQPEITINKSWSNNEQE